MRFTTVRWRPDANPQPHPAMPSGENATFISLTPTDTSSVSRGVCGPRHSFRRGRRWQDLEPATGVSIENRQDLLSHRSGRVTAHYSAAELARLSEAAEIVSDRDGDHPELFGLRSSLHGRVPQNSRKALVTASH
jgi:hypothetical protein